MTEPDRYDDLQDTIESIGRNQDARMALFALGEAYSNPQMKGLPVLWIDWLDNEMGIDVSEQTPAGIRIRGSRLIENQNDDEPVRVDKRIFTKLELLGLAECRTFTLFENLLDPNTLRVKTGEFYSVTKKGSEVLSGLLGMKGRPYSSECTKMHLALFGGKGIMNGVNDEVFENVINGKETDFGMNRFDIKVLLLVKGKTELGVDSLIVQAGVALGADKKDIVESLARLFSHQYIMFGTRRQVSMDGGQIIETRTVIPAKATEGLFGLFERYPKRWVGLKCAGIELDDSGRISLAGDSREPREFVEPPGAQGSIFGIAEKTPASV